MCTVDLNETQWKDTVGHDAAWRQSNHTSVIYIISENHRELTSRHVSIF